MSAPRSRLYAFAPDPAAIPGRGCDVHGCAAAGEYRAPKSRRNLGDYWWFCLEHVRAYNAAWDYHRGMSAAEIEAEIRADTIWQRPTWPLGSLGTGKREQVLEKALGFFACYPAGLPRPAAPSDLKGPLSVLGLSWPVSLPEAKARYHELAKRHHPDRHAGNPVAGERFKEINLAYAKLRARLYSSSPAPPL